MPSAAAERPFPAAASDNPRRRLPIMSDITRRSGACRNRGHPRCGGLRQGRWSRSRRFTADLSASTSSSRVTIENSHPIRSSRCCERIEQDTLRRTRSARLCFGRPSDSRRPVRLCAESVRLQRFAANVPKLATRRTTTIGRATSPTSASSRWSRAASTSSTRTRPTTTRCLRPASTTCRLQCQQCDDAPCVIGLPGRGHLEGRRRDRRHRLRLVHRLPLLRGRLPLPCPALQLDEAGDRGRRDQPRPGLSLEPGAAPGRRGEVPLLSASHAQGEAARPAPRPVRPGRGSSEICWIRTRRSAGCSTTSASSCSRKSSARGRASSTSSTRSASTSSASTRKASTRNVLD